jgi:predicted nucleic acid-binding protein
MPACDFWPDSLSYVNADLGHVRGHRQLTDAYLVSLAAGRVGTAVATLDEGLARELPDLTRLVPAI